MHIDIIAQHEILGKRQQTESDAGSKITRIGHIATATDGTTVKLGESIDKVVALILEAEGTGEVYNFQFLGYLVRLHKLPALLHVGAEEE